MYEISNMYQNLIGQILGPQISPPSKGELCRASVQIYAKTGIGHAEGTCTCTK